MKTKSIAFVLLALLLTATFSLAKSPIERKVYKAIFSLPKEDQLNGRGRLALRRYLRVTTNEQRKALTLLCEEGADTAVAKLRQEVSSIVIDGNGDDWLATSLVDVDKLHDTRAIKADKKAGAAAPCDDLHRFAFAQNDSSLLFMFAPKALPKKGAQFHYRVNLIVGGKIVYAIVWASWGNVIQQWNAKTGAFIKNIKNSSAKFVRGKVFEASVPRTLLAGLPQRYSVQPVVWHEFKNRLDAANGTFRLPPNKSGKKVCLALFCHYANDGWVKPGSLAPIVQALNDGVLYDMASSAELKKQIVRDGRLFQEEALKAGILYSFKDQKSLQKLDLACQLVWANRQGMFGGYNDYAYPFAPDGVMGKEAYEFMTISAKTLQICRKLVQKNKLLVKGDLAATVKKVELWLGEVLKYRRYSVEAIAELARHNPKSQKWQRLAKKVTEEEKYKRQHITSVAGRAVHKGVNWSASFQVDFLLRNNFWYGNCVDVTTVAQAIYKSLGVPAIHICFGPIAPGHYREQHSFPLWFSSADRSWYNFNRQGNVPASWMAKGGVKNEVYFYVNGPQLTSRWSAFKIKEKGASISTNNRALRFIVDYNRWKTIQSDGFAHSLLKAKLAF